MNGSRRWWWRLAVGALAFAGAEAVVTLINARADELRLALVVALVVGAAAVLADASAVAPAVWTSRVELEGGLGRLDPRTAAYLRVLEGHLSAKEADAALQQRLRELADRTLHARHDLSVRDPKAEELLGPELRRVLAEAPRRLHPDEVMRCVARIETL